MINNLPINRILNGDALLHLKELPDECIDLCITSPPYWNLRNYNVDGQIGLENDFDIYIDKLVNIFKEVKRILKKTGSFYLNISDTYYGGGNNRGSSEENLSNIQFGNRGARGQVQPKWNYDKYKAKCMCCIPERLIIKLIDSGWILRSKIIWHKPNVMPSPVKDRYTLDYEMLYFFVKKKKYYFEQQYEEFVSNSYDKKRMKNRREYNGKWSENNQSAIPNTQRAFVSGNKDGRNKRTVWTISPKGFLGAHFATFPEELIKTPILASCPEFICNDCGKPREKIYEKQEYIGKEKEASGKFKDSKVNSAGARKHNLSEQRKFNPNQKEVALFIKDKIKGKEKCLDKTFGNTTWTHWIRTDESGASLPSPEQYLQLKSILDLDDKYDKEMFTTVKVLVDDKGNKDIAIGLSDCGCKVEFSSGIVLDPFFGSGTTGVVALKLDRKFIGIELNPEYIKIAQERLKPYLEQKSLDKFKSNGN